MGKVILGVTISLDGFAEDSKGSVGALYPDLEILDNTEVLKESIRNTGAVVMAWKEFAMAEDPDWYAGNYEYQVPIFVVGDKLSQKHPQETADLKFTFVEEGFERAIQLSREVAGEKDITIIGSASTTQECIKARLADQLHIDILPVFLYNGFRPFEDLGSSPIQIERIKVVELPAGRIHMRFRFIK